MSKCGFCSTVGHNIRTCNSPRIQQILTVIEAIATTEDSLLRYLYQCSPATLSIIMIHSYGASGITSLNKQSKIMYIRNKWRIDNLTAGHQAPVMPVVDHNQICQAAANRIYTETCVRDWNIATINSDSTEETLDLVEPFILTLACEIVNTSGNNYTYSLSIRDKLIRLLRLEGAFENHTRMFLTRAITAQHNIRAFGINDNVNAFVRTPLDSLQQLPPPTPTRFAPHKPKFALIKFSSPISDTINDFTCGVCADELSQQTMPILGCKHALCSDCIIGQIKARTKSFICCPFCREEVKEVSLVDYIARNKLYSFMTNEI